MVHASVRRRGAKVDTGLGAKLESNDMNYLGEFPRQQKAFPGAKLP
jgi:hypothetical protein